VKAAEIWAEAKAGLSRRGHHDTSLTSSVFASGIRAVAVEILTQCKGVLNDEDANTLYKRFMAEADRIEKMR
jgi:hypothetical protein